jgi:PAS domain S-box-containing protein
LGKHRAHWSDEIYRVFGFGPQALDPSYKVFISFVHPEDKERVRGSIRGALYGDGPEGIEYRIVRLDGEVRFVHTQYEVTYDEGGRPTKFVGTVQDVTDRKRVERKLKEAEERYRLLVEQIPAVAYIDRADAADVAFYTSPRIETLLGYTPKSGWAKACGRSDCTRTIGTGYWRKTIAPGRLRSRSARSTA